MPLSLVAFYHLLDDDKEKRAFWMVLHAFRIATEKNLPRESALGIIPADADEDVVQFILNTLPPGSPHQIRNAIFTWEIEYGLDVYLQSGDPLTYLSMSVPASGTASVTAADIKNMDWWVRQLARNNEPYTAMLKTYDQAMEVKKAYQEINNAENPVDGGYYPDTPEGELRLIEALYITIIDYTELHETAQQAEDRRRWEAFQAQYGPKTGAWSQNQSDDEKKDIAGKGKGKASKVSGGKGKGKTKKKSDYKGFQPPKTPPAVAASQRLSPIEIEMLCWEMLRAIKDAQEGRCYLEDWTNDWDYSHYPSFRARFMAVLDVLRKHKTLVKNLTNSLWKRRLAAAPEKEAHRKEANKGQNEERNLQVKLANAAMKGNADDTTLLKATNTIVAGRLQKRIHDEDAAGDDDQQLRKRAKVDKSRTVTRVATKVEAARRDAAARPGVQSANAASSAAHQRSRGALSTVPPPHQPGPAAPSTAAALVRQDYPSHEGSYENPAPETKPDVSGLPNYHDCLPAPPAQYMHQRFPHTPTRNFQSFLPPISQASDLAPLSAALPPLHPALHHGPWTVQPRTPGPARYGDMSVMNQHPQSLSYVSPAEMTFSSPSNMGGGPPGHLVDPRLMGSQSTPPPYPQLSPNVYQPQMGPMLSRQGYGMPTNQPLYYNQGSQSSMHPTAPRPAPTQVQVYDGTSPPDSLGLGIPRPSAVPLSTPQGPNQSSGPQSVGNLQTHSDPWKGKIEDYSS
ncbi:uncharacterized protein E0L32_010325 [Thyridium curvatum]|uniref:Uncharacterized protein n=1 Tax=Thyridium curvatum TaxID=1093900 RepID=A0A507ANP2_9PEZI|nr:uncharacterized protein E0L32_010325 [Thyridium curvatum]TPX07994.1 hypothetical protein E0L32_010325 [Thyridium curvatum]